jgi:hypothetical protein
LVDGVGVCEEAARVVPEAARPMIRPAIKVIFVFMEILSMMVE